jgi:mannitol operon repressor
MTEPDSRETWLAKNPHLRNFMPFLDTLNRESERGAVLVAVSFIEQQLAEILRAFMLDEKPVAVLFEGYNAPLGSLSSRSTAAFALGLITDVEFSECNCLRKIRNEFAHNYRASFADRKIIDYCAALVMRAKDYTSETRGQVTVPPRGQFTTAATALILNFVNRAHYVQRQRVTSRAWPF